MNNYFIEVKHKTRESNKYWKKFDGDTFYYKSKRAAVKEKRNLERIHSTSGWTYRVTERDDEEELPCDGCDLCCECPQDSPKI